MPSAPALPDDIDAAELDGDVRAELLSLARGVAEVVARHLVAAGRLIDDDPSEALEHAMAARRLAARIPAVREAVGIAAYRAGEWQTAISELRTYHRLSGRQTHLAMLADCERALGRPERAIDLYRGADRAQLDPAEALELLIVAAGARADLGQHDAAVAMLQVRELTADEPLPWVARLRYAYADALLAAGRREESREWFARTAAVDEDSDTDAADRMLELDGVVLDDGVDLDDEFGEDGEDGEAAATAGERNAELDEGGDDPDTEFDEDEDEDEDDLDEDAEFDDEDDFDEEDDEDDEDEYDEPEDVEQARLNEKSDTVDDLEDEDEDDGDLEDEDDYVDEDEFDADDLGAGDAERGDVQDQDAEGQDVKSRDVASQDVEGQDVEGQHVASQDVASQDAKGREVESPELKDGELTDGLKADQRDQVDKEADKEADNEEGEPAASGDGGDVGVAGVSRHEPTA